MLAIIITAVFVDDLKYDENLNEVKEILVKMIKKFDELKGRMIRIVARMKQYKNMTAKQIENNLRYFDEIVVHLNEEVGKLKLQWNENKWKMYKYAESIDNFLNEEFKIIIDNVIEVEKLALPRLHEEVKKF